MPTPLPVAAIHFLNPAPLMWDLEHPPLAAELASRYTLHYTAPSQCAEDLLSGRAALGLIPVAALTADLAVVPGCTIASLSRVRSILLLLRPGQTLEAVRTIAADTASRSSVAYAEVLFRHFLHTDPTFLPAPADPIPMLAQADAALLIGDPALHALERRAHIDQALGGPCQYLDLAHEWHTRTGLPWVAAVWACRPDLLAASGLAPAQLIADLQLSRDHGLQHIEDLVREWSPRLPLPPETVRTYLTQNIHFTLDQPCLDAISLFRRLAATIGALPPLAQVHMLQP